MSFVKDKLKEQSVSIVTGQSFKFVEAVLELFLPLVMADLIDIGIKNADKPYIYQRASLMLLIVFIGLVCALICQYIATKVAFNFGSTLRHSVFEHINKLSAKERLQLSDNSITTRITNDINILQDAMAMLIRLVVRAPFLVIGAVIMAISLNIKLSVVFIVTAPLIAFSIYYILKLIAPNFTYLQTLLDKIGKLSLETQLGARVIRALSRQKMMGDKFSKVSREYTEKSIETGRVSALLSPLTSVIMNLGVVFVLILSAPMVQKSEIQIGIVLAFIQYLAQILLQTGIVANLVVLYTRAYASMQRVDEIMGMTSSVRDIKYSEKENFNFETLEFSNVNFSYTGGKNALSDINFSLKRGETIGIIGGTGAGKTSLAKLMLRLYENTEGDILFNGQSVRNIPLYKYRAMLSIAFQNPSFISKSIEENLLLNKKNINDENLSAVLNISDANFVYEKEGGLSETVQEGASNFSGGQKQRLSIARALLQDGDIIIFDDCFSALDYTTEANIKKALYDIKGDRSYVFISQRISSVRNADNILVMDKGKIAESGTHEELLKKGGLYKEIYLSQTEEDEEDGQH